MCPQVERCSSIKHMSTLNRTEKPVPHGCLSTTASSVRIGSRGRVRLLILGSLQAEPTVSMWCLPTRIERSLLPPRAQDLEYTVSSLSSRLIHKRFMHISRPLLYLCRF